MHLRTWIAVVLLVGAAQAAEPLAREWKFWSPSSKSRPPERAGLTIHRAASEIKIDGKLNEPAWEKAVAIEKFLLYPSGEPDPRPVKVMLTFDEKNFYVGMKLYGDNLKNLRLVEQKGKDTYGGHGVEIWLDTECKGEDSYHVLTNAIGTRYDETMAGGPDWQGNWQALGQVLDDHWTVEFAFPFADAKLPGPPIGKAWGANFARFGERSASWNGKWAEMPLYNLIFFETDKEYRAAQKPTIRLILDREEYDPLDVTGVGLVSVFPRQHPLNQLQVKVEAVGGGANLLEPLVVKRMEECGLDITVNTAAFPMGRFTLRATLMDHAGKPLAISEAPLHKIKKRAQLAEPERQSVKINVWPVETDQLGTWPISTGIPMPQGVLSSSDHVRLLDAKGREVPCQAAMRTSWNRRGTVQWLGLDFPAELRKTGTTYSLEFGSQVKRAIPPNPLRVTQSADLIRVTTGPLEFTVKRRGFNLLDEVLFDGKLILKQDPRSGLEITDHEGTVYRASNDPDCEVTIEESGPLKIIIRAAGWYVKDGTTGKEENPFLPTDRLCKHITRITAYAGQAHVDVQHIFIITYDTNKVRLLNIGLSERVPESSRLVFGLDNKPHEIPISDTSVRLYQRSWNYAQIENDVRRKNHWGIPAEEIAIIRLGKQADGWTRVETQNGNVTLCIRDLWQSYPKEVEVAEGRLWAHVWPRHGRLFPYVNDIARDEIYHLWWVHQGRELDFRMPERIYQAAYEYAEADLCRYEVDNCRYNVATGLALETNLSYFFHSATAKEDSARFNSVWQLEPHALVEPKWLCESQVFGPMLPVDKERFPGLEKHWEYNVFARLRAQEQARDYGMFNWQDVHSDNSHYRNGYWGLNRVWNQGHHGTARLPWLLYVRSGDPRYLQFARRLARHVMNVDVIHYVKPGYDPFAGVETHGYPLAKNLGAMYHVKGFAHWACDNGIASHVAHYDFMLWDYFLTGNRRGLEVAQQWAEAMKRASPHGGHGRDFTTPWAEVTEYYRFTFDPDMLEILRRYHDAAVTLPFAKHGWFDYAPALERYLRFTGFSDVRQRALEFGEMGGGQTNYAALMFYETGEKRYLTAKLPKIFWHGLDESPWRYPIPQVEGISSWYNITYAIQYGLPFQRALADAGIPFHIAQMSSQYALQTQGYFIRKQTVDPVPLKIVWGGYANEKWGLSILGPDGNQVLNQPLGPYQDKPTPIETQLIGPPGIYTVKPQWQWYKTTMHAPLTNLPEVFLIRPGERAFISGPNVWYFRTGPKQTQIRWSFTSNLTGQLVVRTADGKSSVASAGATTMQSEVKAQVQPNTFYYLATVGYLSNGAWLTPHDEPLILAMTPEKWFEPPAQPAK